MAAAIKHLAYLLALFGLAGFLGTELAKLSGFKANYGGVVAVFLGVIVVRMVVWWREKRQPQSMPETETAGNSSPAAE